MLRLRFAIALLFSIFASNAGAVVYNAASDFTLAANPNGVWSYGYSPLFLPYSMVLFDSNDGLTLLKSGYNTLNTPSAVKNTTGVLLNGIAPNQFSLHPGPVPNGDFSILRFTAPGAGAYSVVGQFFAGDSGAMSGAIVLNGDHANPLQFFPVTTNASIFSPLLLNLAANDFLDFVVGNNGSFFSGSTPLDVTISSASEVLVPEPSTVMIFVLGSLLTIAAYSGLMSQRIQCPR